MLLNQRIERVAIHRSEFEFRAQHSPAFGVPHLVFEPCIDMLFKRVQCRVRFRDCYVRGQKLLVFAT